MTTVPSELTALRETAGIFPLTDRAFLRITGPDATRWLNGMVTNNIRDLAPGHGNVNFLLNAQGRIQGTCTIYREPHAHEPTFLLETDTTQLDTIHQLLDRFIIMDDVELSTALSIAGVPAQPFGYALLGALSSKLLTTLFSDHHENSLPTPPAPGTITLGRVNGSPILLLAPPAPAQGYEIWFPDAKEAELQRSIMLKSGGIEVSAETLEDLRILSGIPKYGTDIRNSEKARDLPQETAQTHALNFSKGCYLGQEIVERIRSRGQVHRTFTAFTLTGSLPALPAPLESPALSPGEKARPAGELTSAALIDGTLHALGYTRRELLETHAPLTYPGGTATPKS